MLAEREHKWHSLPTKHDTDLSPLDPANAAQHTTARLYPSYSPPVPALLPSHRLTWTSVDGFQSGSYSSTRLAPVRFTPSPPTRVVSRNRNTAASAAQHGRGCMEGRQSAVEATPMHGGQAREYCETADAQATAT